MVEPTEDVFHEDVPDQLHHHLYDDEPDDDPLEARRVPHLELVFEHLEHAVEHLHALVEDVDALVDLEVLARVPEQRLPVVVLPEEVGAREHVTLEVDRGVDDEQMPDELRDLRLREGDVPRVGKLLGVEAGGFEGLFDAQLQRRELRRLGESEGDGQLLERRGCGQADLVVVEACFGAVEERHVVSLLGLFGEGVFFERANHVQEELLLFRLQPPEHHASVLVTEDVLGREVSDRRGCSFDLRGEVGVVFLLVLLLFRDLDV
mmetsp:Transcript_13133/g.30462  ORF Transcript_13133/g.30462 Transcript_13133/m.30462 type:complete len:263 (+) Transcript_13133:71-859(+)